MVPSAEVKAGFYRQRGTSTLGARSVDLLWSKAPELAVAALSTDDLDPRVPGDEILDQRDELERRPGRSVIIDLDPITRRQPRPARASALS